MEKVICCPHEYYGSQFSKFIDSEARSSKHSWIYDIIAAGAASKHEQVYIEREQWCLVLDKHHGHDTSYLVVFRDTSLRTIRDLREQHVTLLQNIYETVSKWLWCRTDKTYHFYFNYMPSVFQLHLHVNSNTQHINRERAHFCASCAPTCTRIPSMSYCSSLGGVILVAPVASAVRCVSASARLPGWLLTQMDSWMLPNIKFIGNVTCPVQFVHGTEDSVVPLLNNSLALIDSLRSPQRSSPLFVKAGHNDIESRHGVRFLDTLHTFLRTCACRAATEYDSTDGHAKNTRASADTCPFNI